MQTKLSILIALIIIFISCVSDPKLPILNSYINDNGVKTTYRVIDFEFHNQLNEKITDKSMLNKVYVSNFFFTRCNSICPKMKDSLIKVADEFKNENNFGILSFSIDPTHDSIPILKLYANGLNSDNTKWHFLNGTDKQLEYTAKLFRTSFHPIKNNIDFYHSPYVALVDKKQQIRGFYNILETGTILKLINDIKFLLK